MNKEMFRSSKWWFYLSLNMEFYEVISTVCEITILLKLIIERYVINSCRRRKIWTQSLPFRPLFHKLFLLQPLTHSKPSKRKLLLLYSLNNHHYYNSLSYPTVLAAGKGGDNKDLKKLYFPTWVHQLGWRSLWEILKSAFSRENNDSINSEIFMLLLL